MRKQIGFSTPKTSDIQMVISDEDDADCNDDDDGDDPDNVQRMNHIQQSISLSITPSTSSHVISSTSSMTNSISSLFIFYLLFLFE